jgi:hypothetical protein
MKLTIKENPEGIKRYAHVKPAPLLGGSACSARCPGTSYACTLERGHTGVHVAHGRFRRVVAVWDREARGPEPGRKGKGSARAMARRDAGRRRLPAALKGLWKRIVPRPHAVEAFLLILMVLGMLGFAIDLAIRIFGAF